MFDPWEDPLPPGHPGHAQLRMYPAGGFPVPGAISPDALPPAVKASLMRLLDGPPKPSVAPEVMQDAQFSMIAPAVPFRPRR